MEEKVKPWLPVKPSGYYLRHRVDVNNAGGGPIVICAGLCSALASPNLKKVPLRYAVHPAALRLRVRDIRARRFVNLIDELYDRQVNLVCTAQDAPPLLYSGTRLAGAFERTASRLIEMQSTEYLGTAHRL